MPGSYIKDAYKPILAHPQWETEAKHYEKNLAAKLYNDPKVMASAQTALVKISRTMQQYYTKYAAPQKPSEELEGLEEVKDVAASIVGGDKDDTGKVEVDNILTKAMLKDMPSSAGQVGVSKKLVGPEPVDDNPEGLPVEGPSNLVRDTSEEGDEQNRQLLDEVINEDGNLREKMTAIYNGALLNSGMTYDQTSQSTSLKRMARDVTKKQAKELGLDYKEIKRDRSVFKNWDMLDVKHIAITGPSSLKKIIKLVRGIKSRKERPQEEQEEKMKTPQYYEQRNMPLSEREKKYAIQGGNLQWKEGKVYSSLDPESSWVKSRKKKGFRLVTGPSGTTMRMLRSYKWMKASSSELLDFRLALMAWMLVGDHSMYEIMLGSHAAGVKGKEDMTNAISMYQTVDPLTRQELRDKAENKQFPHERIYTKILMDDYSAHNAEFRSKNIPVKLDKNGKPIPMEIDGQYKAEAVIPSGQWAKLGGKIKKDFDYNMLDEWVDDPSKTHLLPTNEQITAWEDLKEKNVALGDKKLARAPRPDGYPVFDRALTAEWRDYVEYLLDLANVSKKVELENDPDQDRSKMAAKAAFNVYTSSDYKSMNPGMMVGNKIARQFNKKQTRMGHDQDEYFDKVRMSARMAQESFADMPRYGSGDTPKHVYRGARILNPFKNKFAKKGNVITTSGFTSTSNDPDVAANFYNDAKGKKVLMDITLRGYNGVLITEFARYNEGEVLLAPGSRLKVTKGYTENKDLKGVTGDNKTKQYNIVKLEEEPAPVPKKSKEKTSKQPEAPQVQSGKQKSLPTIDTSSLKMISSGKYDDQDKKNVSLPSSKSPSTQLLDPTEVNGSDVDVQELDDVQVPQIDIPAELQSEWKIFMLIKIFGYANNSNAATQILDDDINDEHVLKACALYAVSMSAAGTLKEKMEDPKIEDLFWSLKHLDNINKLAKKLKGTV